MRALHLDAGKEMRGGQWQALRLIEGLEAEGVESTLLARAGGPLFGAAERAGCRVAPLTFARVAAEARKHDVTHAHDARSHTLAALAGGAPLVVSRRVAFAPSGKCPISVASRWKYGRAAQFIAVSEFVKTTLLERGVPAAKISVVYDGVPVVVTAQAPGASVVAPETGDPQKGAALAAEAARLAGVDLLFSDALERDLERARLFVYITHSEGLGSAVLLAMSAGVPVIASAVGGLQEIIRHGENGILTANAPVAIAEAMRAILGDAELARRLGDAGRRTVTERFSVARMVRSTIEVYRRVIP